jgi:hypothetical protein
MKRRIRKNWTDAETRRLRKMHAAGHGLRHIAQRMQRERSIIARHLRILGLRLPNKRKLWTAAEDQLLRAHYPTGNTAALCRLLDRKPRAIYQRAEKFGLHKSIDVIRAEASANARKPGHGGSRTRFVKGQTPANKGLRRPGWHAGRMRETQFKKGRPAHESRNYVPIGTEKIDQRRNVLVRKLTDDPRLFPVARWRPVHVIVWESVHGPVPPGHIVVFKPGMKTLDPKLITEDRLELVSHAENMRRNSYHTRYPKEIGLAIQARGALMRQINKRSKAA